MTPKQMMKPSSSGFSRSLANACADNDVNTVKRLLSKSNLNNAAASTDEGESLLSMACSAGYYELAQVLLAMSENKKLVHAVVLGELHLVELLLSNNADVNAPGALIKPLIYACMGGQLEMVQLLLRNGANVDAQDDKGYTPLMMVAMEGHVEVAKVLLKHGAGINNEFLNSALTLACHEGHLDMVRLLLQAAADHKHKIVEMQKALIAASKGGHVEVARLLLDSGVSMRMDSSSITLAVNGGHVKLATLLSERKEHEEIMAKLDSMKL